MDVYVCRERQWRTTCRCLVVRSYNMVSPLHTDQMEVPARLFVPSLLSLLSFVKTWDLTELATVFHWAVSQHCVGPEFAKLLYQQLHTTDYRHHAGQNTLPQLPTGIRSSTVWVTGQDSLHSSFMYVEIFPSEGGGSPGQWDPVRHRNCSKAQLADLSYCRPASTVGCTVCKVWSCTACSLQCFVFLRQITDGMDYRAT